MDAQGTAAAAPELRALEAGVLPGGRCPPPARRCEERGRWAAGEGHAGTGGSELAAYGAQLFAAGAGRVGERPSGLSPAGTETGRRPAQRQALPRGRRTGSGTAAAR